MTKGKKTAKEILEEVKLALGLEKPAEPIVAPVTQAAQEVAAPPAPITEPAQDQPARIALAASDPLAVQATIDVVNALCEKVWTMSNTMQALSQQLQDAASGLYQTKEEAQEAAVGMRKELQAIEAKGKEVSGKLLEAITALSDLPTATPSTPANDQRGKKGKDTVGRFAAAFKEAAELTAH